MVTVVTVDDPMYEDVFGLLNEVGLHNWWWLVQAMSQRIIIVHMVHFEEGDKTLGVLVGRVGGEMAHPLHDPKWPVVPQDQPAMTLQSLQALVVREETEKDSVANLIFGFPPVSINVFLHLLCGMGEGLPCILQLVFTMCCVLVCRQKLA